MIEVELPDGSIAEFPDGTPREVMQGAIKKRLGMAAPQPAPAGGGVAIPPRADTPMEPNKPRPTLDQRVSGAIKNVTDFTGGVINKAMEGMTFGLLGDEARAAIGSAASPKTYDQALNSERAAEAKFAADYPVASTAAEIGGALMSPTGAASTIGGAALRAGAQGAVTSFMEGEGGAAERAKEAAKGGVASLLFGGAFAAGQKGISAGLDRLFRTTAQKPTVEGLRSLKNAAYKAVDSAGQRFDAQDLEALATTARQNIDAGYNFFPETDVGTAAALAMLDRTAKAGAPLTLSQLDKMRQGMWKLYSRTDEPGVLDVISEIDGLIDSRAGASAVMGAAREANSRFRKAELLQDAFDKARMQTQSTGSGGNILNKYKQAVTAIVTNPKKAKWFSAEETAAMEKFIEGSLPENILRRIGKLAPGGNGLMLALNLVAGSVNPGFLVATAAAQGAKSLADRSGQKGAEALQGLVSGAPVVAPVRNLGPASRLGGAAGSQAVRD